MKKDITVNMTDNDGATPIAKLVQVANSYGSSIYLLKDTMKVNAKSIMGMMNLVISPGTSVSVEIVGDDEEEAMRAVEGFLSGAED